jgi:hypothetical protein
MTPDGKENFDEEAGFPREFVSAKVKEDPKYGRLYAKAIYGRYMTKGGFHSETNGRYIINRKYAEGLQGVDKYKDLLDVEGDSSAVNLDWSVVPIIAKYVDLLVGEFTNKEYEIKFNAVDPMSQMKKEEERTKLEVNYELKEFDQEMRQMAGIGVIPEGEMIPEDRDEIELFMQMNFKQETEIAMEEVTSYVLDFNNWEEIRRKVLRDLIVLKKGVIKIFRDENGAIRLRYVDPVNWITPMTDQDDHSNLKYAAELRNLEIHQIRRMAGNELSEEDLYNIAKKYAGQHGNRKWTYANSYQTYYNDNGYSGTGDLADWDDFSIPVLDFEFHTIDTKVFEEKEGSHGQTYIEEKEFGYEPKKKGSKIHNRELDTVYQGHWIVGSEYIFDYGPKPNATYEKKNGHYMPETCLSYIAFSPDMYEMENKSIVERMIPHADAVQLISLKIQLLIAKLTPPGLAVDVSALNNVLLGKGKEAAPPLKLMELYNQTGLFFYNGIDDDNQPMNRNPIHEIQNSIGTVLQEMVATYNFHVQQIRDVTGINELREASSIDKDAPVRSQELALNASRNSTRMIEYSYINIYQRAAKEICLNVQDMADYNNGLENFEGAIGIETTKILKQGKDISLAEFGIKIEALPDEEEKAQLNHDIERALQTQELRLEDAIIVRKIPNIKVANQYLILRKRQYAKEKAEEAQMASEQNAMLQQQAAEAAAQAEAQKEMAKAEAEKSILMLKYDLENQNAEAEHKRKMKEISLENEYKSIHIEQASEEDFKKTALSNSMSQPRVFSKNAGGSPPTP